METKHPSYFLKVISEIEENAEDSRMKLFYAFI
jgi:hypothetical protein